ncbi:hypothetical protein GOP47_0017107 [Adiantum capillus-veneris]|uniref:Homeobox domain-containing protein n=1 Tax=Adiantum capillus-veneris TaxID=13818 RepID=A0A9D4ZC59_ADICA|nr:hypothetical protein GOP47_0016530 [Adiantum capillus-veneris]KAI5068762.1 hypothetical protein GOP47_0017107 [Adiantum capillus-veneris]
MQITDHSKEQVLRGVQRLRTMASSAHASNYMGSSVATELSMSLTSSAGRPIKPSPTPPPLQLDLLPLYPSNPNPSPSYTQQHHLSTSCNPKLLFPKGQLFGSNVSVNTSLMRSNSPFTHITPSLTQQTGHSHSHPLLQAGLSVSPSFLQVSKAADVGYHNAPALPQAGRGVDIDVNQVPSSSESEDEDGDDEGAYPSLPFSESINNNGLQRGGAYSAMEGSPASLKREREKMGSENNHTNNSNNMYEVSSRASDEEEGASTRKKLRLSKEQSALLEESFKEHSTLNPKQKNALAKQLSLRPRQVEVWFQNRRARTKLKQTEIDCELLKRCCESLTEENRRLQKEVQELRALKVGAPCVIAHDFYMPLPAATLTMCPSCERLATLDPASRSSAKQHLPSALGFNPHHAQPSAAC